MGKYEQHAYKKNARPEGNLWLVEIFEMRHHDHKRLDHHAGFIE